ncbi:MAG TPA: fatty acyl-AMP ligase, partial [Burkholderiales bacterium]|nr:fatty acyl-AMP ligase [Burkholderiales bacterium]
ARVPIDRSSSIVEVLKRRAEAAPTRPVFTFLHNGEVALEALTFGRLDARAEQYAMVLRETVSPGSRVLLMLPSGYAFIEALFGCFYAGCVAVPVALARKRDFDSPRRRASDDTPLVEKIRRDADAAALITTAELSRTLRDAQDAAQPHAAAIPHILSEEFAGGTATVPSGGATRRPDPSTLAYLQYTSGSTGDPRGVMVSHANVLAAVRGSAAAFQIGEQSRFVSWLPHYHDMGLVGSLLQTIYCGAQCWFMSPQSFIAKPDRWLAAITDVGATISGGPNFAYELCTRSAVQRARDFRLDTWRCAYNGSEPVRLDTLNEFAAAFAGSGFNFENFRPCYGLAEATLQVSGGPIGRAPAVRRVSDETTAGTPLERVSVSCGRPVEGAEVRIVDPDSFVPVPDGAVGEVWVHAPQVGRGYWGKPAASRDAFEARIAGETKDFTYLRTGDAGVMADGELFVLGRYKDAIILNGVNHQPEPIEATVAAAGTAQRLGTVAAVGVSIDGRERLVVVAEIGARLSPQPSSLAEICRELRAAIHRVHDLAVHTIVLVPHLTLPRTTSGKVRRHRVKELFLSCRLNVLRADGVVSGEDAAAPGRSANDARRKPGGGACPRKKTA